MKITVTREFDSVDEAIAFIGAMDASRLVSLDPAELPARMIPGAVVDFVDGAAPPTGKKPRKPRADAGQPRGPYRPRGSAGTAAPETKAEPEGATGTHDRAESTAADQAASAARGAPQAQGDLSAPSGEAPTSVAPVKSSSVEAPQATQAPGATELTEADVRKTLGLLNDAPGGGMGACIKAIKDFGYERITAIPKEKYAEFDAYIRGLLPKGAQ